MRGSPIGIDYDLLRRREPILWFKEVTLFEDELADNGMAVLSVKTVRQTLPPLQVARLPSVALPTHHRRHPCLYCSQRVMPSCFFALLRFWVRVDGVLLRVQDTRAFHRWGTQSVVLEHSLREDRVEELVKVRGRL